MPQETEIQTFDPLSHALDALGLRARLLARVEATGQWGIDLPEAEPAFHAVLTGSARIELADDRGFDLAAGDLLFVLDGKRHRILSRTGRSPVPLDRLLAKYWNPQRCVLEIGVADPSPATIILCGNFSGDRQTIKDLLGNIPTTLMLKRSDFTAIDAVGVTLNLLETEAAASRPGSSIVSARLVELLLAYAIRQLLLSSRLESDSWLRGLLDPSISRALMLMHGDLSRNWSVSELASKVAMSRSTFAARFVECVGEPPAKHLARWRMQIARDLLTRGSQIGEVARRLGYESESAFSRAFSRETGFPPIHFRTTKAKGKSR